MNANLLAFVGTVLLLLGIATFVGQWLRKRESPALDRRAIESFNSRIQAWWFFTAVIVMAFLLPGLTVLLFAAIAFWALREFVTLTPTRIGDHRALFWVFFFFTPMQFLLVYLDKYGLYSVLIPVFAFLFIAARAAVYGDYDRFLERIAKVQCALMICVYCLSYAPALLYLRIEEQSARYYPAGMLFFFITIVLASDLLEWFWSRVYSRHLIAEKIDPVMSWEGVLAGAASTALLGVVLQWASPFPYWWQTSAMALVIALTGAAGSLTMSAIKRDRGEVTSGNFVEGHGGVLGRIDSICFAAPVFYHVTRYFFGVA
ncbi:MAG: phosphatidate cytidylyltransferase [Planctomycetaceae bacterium]|uniref:Phosphatidate cytidylyltransferase n=1 Tax=Lacipirellula limnantheis TaxID=2528024 RepID=A0A517TZX9_9BACT|nr:phosphatidate cytidylyltransferase [Lacipirellula limnantheis]MBL9162699.1 phosphatidate cytidylyltransferase [Planctomycetaceae bacterium]QDT73940.1 Phosphatidate cytidylyltransferase [Lacipirellula limnantheis]